MLRLIQITILSVILQGCATPVSKEIRITKEQIKQEQLAQKEISKTYKPKKISERKHKDINVYIKNLEKVSPKIQAAASKVCPNTKSEYKFKLVDSKDLNAWADGKTVNITPIMMDFLDTEQELALILSHEVAHNAMKHITKKSINAIMGAVVDIAVLAATKTDTQGAFMSIGSHGYSQGFENEADYVGLYIMANAGYDIDNVHNLWRKMSVENPRSISKSFFGSHPSNPERYLRMQKTIAEIKAKQQNNQKLIPESKN